MAAANELAWAGLPAPLAQLLGTSPPRQVAPGAGLNLAGALPIIGNFVFLFPVPAGGGSVYLPRVSGSAMTVLYNADAANACNVYPYPGSQDVLNSWPVGEGVQLPPGQPLLLIPGTGGMEVSGAWICLLGPAMTQVSP
jgi:hypothetical protein